MGLIFTPSSLTFRSLVGNNSTKSVELSSEAFLFTGFTATPGDPFTATDAVIKHLHNGVTFTEGVSYYVQPNGSISETLSTCLIGIGNSTGGLSLTFKRLTIDSLNNGLPFYFIGEFTEGVHYFFTNDGRIVPASDPDITTWYCGIGNADGDIDEDIKQLRIYDVDSPANVQLDVAFNVSGLYVLLAGRIVIEAWNGTAWVKIHPGDYITCLNGDFDETVTIATADGFSVNSVVTIRVRDYETYGLNGSDTSNIISTVTLNAISDVTATVAKTIGGTTNGASVNIYYKLHSAGSWTLAGAGTVDTGAGTWTYSITIPTADTYDIKVVDSNDSAGFALQENVTVASGSLKMQILSENCDFLTVDSVAVSTTDIIVLGTISNYSAGAKVGGISLASNADKAVVRVNIFTGVASWVWSESSAQKISTYQKIRLVGNYVFFGKITVGTTTNISPAVVRIAISNGASNALDIFTYFSATAYAPGINLSSCGSYLYATICPDAAYARVCKIQLDLSAVVDDRDIKDIGAGTVSSVNPVFCECDGTYVYCGYNAYDMNLPQKYKFVIRRVSTSDLTSQSTLRKDYGYGSATPADGTVGYGLVGENASLVVSGVGDSPDNVYWVTDGTTENTVNGLRLKTTDSMLFSFATTIMRRINSTTFAETYAKNYAADGLSGVHAMNKLGTGYYIIGRTVGDFDGDHAGNTKSCLAIAKIDLADGDIQ